MILADQLRERLDHVLDPELGASIVELGMVGAISVDTEGVAHVEFHHAVVEFAFAELLTQLLARAMIAIESG